MKKILLSTLLLLSLLHASKFTIEGHNQMVQTSTPKVSQKVYLGSFLSTGHLPFNDVYRIDIPLDGVVKQLAVSIHQPVKKGQKLLVLKSPDLLELESKYIDLLIEQEYYANEVKRLEPLYKASVVAKKVFLQAKNSLSKYTTQTHFYKNLLLEYGLSKQKVQTITQTKKPIPEITITSPISGKVEDLSIYPHMYVEKGKHLMTIIDNSNTHFEVALPLKIARSLKVGTVLYGNNTRLEVESIASVINPRTQTVTLHLTPSKSLKIFPNEKRNIKLYLPHTAYILPSSAITEIEEKNALFVETSKGYKVVFVTVLSRSNDKVYVISDQLSKDTKIAISGVIALRGALEAGSDD